MALPDRKDPIRPGNAKALTIRKALTSAAENYDQLVELWENIHGQEIVVTKDKEIKAALKQARQLTGDPRVVEIYYDPKSQFDLFVLKLTDGSRTFIGREKMQGLQNAKQSQIANIEILGNGTGLHWPDLNIDYSIAGLLSGIYGNKQ